MLSGPSHAPKCPRKLNKKELKPLLKFYMKNELAYTEDHIPVKKLHLFGMPMELTSDALLDYFTRNYGPTVVIERIQHTDPIDEEQNYLPTWKAFALFANARDAAKVLQISEHRVNIYKFHVQASYSWLQPFDDEDSNNLEFAPSPHILSLNDDCLENVFQYLSLADHIRLARTCKRFRTIYQRISARQHKTVCYEITNDLTLWETRDFCQLSGHHVESLECGTNGNGYFMRCFWSTLYFPYLKKLDLFDTQLKAHKLQRILLGMSMLKDLTLWTLPRTDRLDFAQLKELKKLEISDWNTENLSLPLSIESLTLNDWENSSCLPIILKDHTQIKKLQDLHSENVFANMAESPAFASVEVLQITKSDFDGKDLIAQMPKLKKLYVNCYETDTKFVSEFIKHNPQQLEHLELEPEEDVVRKQDMMLITGLIGLQTLGLRFASGIDDEVITEFKKFTELRRFGLYDSEITDGLIMQLMINCPKLSTLRMDSCGKFGEKLVHSIISLVRKDIQSGKNQRDLPFKLYLRKYDILDITSTDPDVVEVIVRESEFSEWFEEELRVMN